MYNTCRHKHVTFTTIQSLINLREALFNICNLFSITLSHIGSVRARTHARHKHKHTHTQSFNKHTRRNVHSHIHILAHVQNTNTQT